MVRLLRCPDTWTTAVITSSASGALDCEMSAPTRLNPCSISAPNATYGNSRSWTRSADSKHEVSN